MSNNQQIAFRADDDLRSRIEAAAGERHGAISDLLRKAVTEHLARIAGANLGASAAGVSFLTGSILAASSTIVSRSATEIKELADAFRSTAAQAALSAEDRAALVHAADFLQGSADALQSIAAHFRFSPETQKVTT